MTMRRVFPAVILPVLLLAGCSGGGGGTTTPPEQPAATPTFSPSGGTYTSIQKVSLSDATTGASIYYTTDGSTPTAQSTLFSPATPIAVSTTTTINAIAVASGFANSAVATGTYTFPG